MSKKMIAFHSPEDDPFFRSIVWDDSNPDEWSDRDWGIYKRAFVSGFQYGDVASKRKTDNG